MCIAPIIFSLYIILGFFSTYIITNFMLTINLMHNK